MMSFSRSRLFELSRVVVGCAAFVLVAGSAAAQDFPDSEWFWTDDDESQAWGFVQTSGTTMYSEAFFDCPGAEIGIWTNHADRGSVRKRSAAVSGGVRDNNAIVQVFHGEGNFVYLTCERASVKAGAKFTKTDAPGQPDDGRGSASGKAKNCTCEVPGPFNANLAAECAAFEADLENIADSCSSFSRIRGRINDTGDEITRLSIRSRSSEISED